MKKVVFDSESHQSVPGPLRLCAHPVMRRLSQVTAVDWSLELTANSTLPLPIHQPTLVFEYLAPLKTSKFLFWTRYENFWMYSCWSKESQATVNVDDQNFCCISCETLAIGNRDTTGFDPKTLISVCDSLIMICILHVLKHVQSSENSYAYFSSC